MRRASSASAVTSTDCERRALAGRSAVPNDLPDQKRCIKCGALKSHEHFYRATGMRDGLRNDCKECMLALRRANYRGNRDAYIRRAQEWKREHRERYLEGQRRRRSQRGPEQIRLERHQHLRRTYGMSLEEFEFLVAAQGGACAICGKPDADRLHVDHDHGTGRIRGLLCGSCNRAMGLFHEDPARFEAAGSYLRQKQLRLGSGDKTPAPVRKVRRGS